jgi:IS5 family transposase
MEFLGLGIEDSIPDAKTFCLFRDNLAKDDLAKEV